MRHDIKSGITITVVEYGAGSGRAVVTCCQQGCIELVLLADPAPPYSRHPTFLIAAVPRPQTVKKLIHLATTSGIRALHFVPAYNAQKSYFSSHALKEESIQHEVILGLEQAIDGVPPSVKVHHSFKLFIEDQLPVLRSEFSSKKTLNLVADTHSVRQLGVDGLVLEERSRPVFIAIGPESGWSPRELDRWSQGGFCSVSLGPRMLRVEVAAALLLGQIQLLREL